MCTSLGELCWAAMNKLKGKEVHPLDFFKEIIDRHLRTLMVLEQSRRKEDWKVLSQVKWKLLTLEDDHFNKSTMEMILNEMQLREWQSISSHHQQLLTHQDRTFIKLLQAWDEWKLHFSKHPNLAVREVMDVMERAQFHFLWKEIQEFIFVTNRQINLPFSNLLALCSKYGSESKVLSCISQMISNKKIGFPYKRWGYSS